MLSVGFLSRGWIIVKVIIIVSLWFLSASLGLRAQSIIQLERLSIAIWPEFDRPETLVIYRGKLAESVPLPATLTFNLPGYVQALNAVAVVGDQNSLLNSAYTTEYSNDMLRLNFTIERPGFHFEYYDPVILSKSGVDRTLDYSTQAEYPVANFEIDIQQPSGSTGIRTVPDPTDTFTGDNGLTHHVYRQNNVDLGQAIALRGEYQKGDDSLTTNSAISGPQSAEQDLVLPATSNPPFPIGYWLIALGVVLLVVSVGTWFFLNRPKPAPATVSPARDKAGPVCHNCGTTYHPDAVFCHVCGASRQIRKGKKRRKKKT